MGVKDTACLFPREAVEMFGILDKEVDHPLAVSRLARLPLSRRFTRQLRYGAKLPGQDDLVAWRQTIEKFG